MASAVSRSPATTPTVAAAELALALPRTVMCRAYRVSVVAAATLSCHPLAAPRNRGGTVALPQLLSALRTSVAA